MAIPDPQLDDRRFQEIVNEAKQLIPRFCPEWTDHNVSDPGVTLIELFSYMVDMLLYRVNRVPDKMYLRFMDLLGIRVADATPARTRLMFALTAAQEVAVTIPSGTEVSTVASPHEEPVSFTTDENLVLFPPVLRNCLVSPDEVTFATVIGDLDSGGFQAFRDTPLPGDGVYFGFAEDISSHLISVAFDAAVAGIGIDPRDPPLAWEAWCGDVEGWTRVTVDSDSSGGFNEQGNVVMELPEGMQMRLLSGPVLFWLRVRVVQPRPGQAAYSRSPRIRSAVFTCMGGAAWASHSAVVEGEILGRASGAASESFDFTRKPLLARRSGEHIEVLESDAEDGWVAWQEVDSFQESTPDDRHYVVDGVSGSVSFGPVVRHFSGLEVAHGRAPGAGHLVRMSRYRFGGGAAGNVSEHSLVVLRSSTPYVASVTNRRPATGGIDPESLDEARLRAPSALRSQNRAVTPADYEFLASQASRRVARVKCVPVRSERNSTVPPGTVELLILPRLPDGVRSLEALAPPPDLIQEVREYLDERRMLGTALVVDGPAYIGVRVEVTVVARPGTIAEAIQAEVATRIARYLDPLVGSSDGLGWPFGRDLYASELQSVIAGVRGVDYVRETNLFSIDVDTGQARSVGQQLTLAEDVLLLPSPAVVTIATDR